MGRSARLDKGLKWFWVVASRMRCESFRIVRASNKVDRPKLMPYVFLILLKSRTTIRDCPPSSKKSSSRPTCSCPNNSCHHPAKTDSTLSSEELLLDVGLSLVSVARVIAFGPSGSTKIPGG